MTTLSAPSPLSSLLKQYYVLTKPRVNALILFCAVIGMLLAQPELPALGLVLLATLGIGLVAGAAAAVNCLVESHIDAKMARTSWRPLPSGTLTVTQVFVFSGVLGGLGLFVLFTWVNALTAWLTLATFVGYAIVYTMLLKPLTPQNIVIGGASGAMPPVLGWAAVANHAPAEAWVLFLIIFVWTPPHFWALALYRVEDYKRSGLPMLPVTNGSEFTRLQILLYTLLPVATTLLPVAMGMASWIYMLSALGLGGWFSMLSYSLYRRYSEALAKKTFRYSINYLALLFAFLLADHYLLGT